MSEQQLFKNIINSDLIDQLSDAIKKVSSDFDSKNFLKIKKELTPLEMKARVVLIAKTLHETFRSPVEKNLEIIAKITKKGDLSGFTLWPFSTYVELYGLEHLEEALDAMEEITKHFTSEFAVRPYLINAKTRAKTLKRIHSFTKASNVHLRRFASEGTRTRLPWGAKLNDFIKDPTLGLEIVEKLKYDEELYVRKSVANHLNDLTKDHPELIIKTLKKWEKECPVKHTEKIQWIKKHALRTLIKKGDKETLKMFGVDNDAQFDIKNFKLTKNKIKLGEELEFSFDLLLKKGKAQKVIIDYGIGFLKKNGTHNIKIFKGKAIALDKKGHYSYKKKHKIKFITTMTFYPGDQFLVIQVNGEQLHRSDWKLLSV